MSEEPLYEASAEEREGACEAALGILADCQGISCKNN